MTRTGAVARPPIEDRADSYLEWMQLHLRELAIGAIVLASALAAFWLYRNTQQSKETQGERALDGAQRSFLSGNLPLAQSDLQKVQTRYDGTSAGVQASMLLAQVLFEQQKYAEGVKALEKAEESGAAKPFLASLHSLKAAGYEDQNKLKDAAAEYQKASDASQFTAEKQQLRGHAARAALAAGDTATARKTWEELAKDPSSALAGEARIRLGEITAKPIGQR